MDKVRQRVTKEIWDKPLYCGGRITYTREDIGISVGSNFGNIW